MKKLKTLLTHLPIAALIVFGAVTATLGMSTYQAANAQDLSVGGGATSAKGGDQPDDLFGSTGVFKTITNVMLFLIGAISVIMLIIGGIRYVVSGGEQAAITSAKNTILYAIVGIIVAILAFAIVNFVTNQFSEQGNKGISAITYPTRDLV